MSKNVWLNNETILADLIQNLSLGLFIFNSDCRILDANRAVLDFFRVSSISGLEKKNVAELLRLRPTIENLDLTKEERSIQEFELDMKEERIFNVLLVIRPFRDVSLGKILYEAALLEINDRKLEQAAPPPETLRDPLTGCYSKLYLSEFQEQAQAWGCLVAYLDHFKQFRDRYGMGLALDATLKMSRFLMRHIRAEDGVVKLDNDHFVILLNGADVSGVQRVMRRVRAAALGQAPLRFSIGGAARNPSEPVHETIQRADLNLTPVPVLERIPAAARTRGVASEKRA